MDLNGPGTSLFQGNDLSNFDSLAQREEEEEAIEEQKRRDLELKSMLENAFDDVSFDNDDGSICNGSRNNSTSEHLIFQNNSYPEVEPSIYKQVSPGKVLVHLDKRSNHVENFDSPLKHSAGMNSIKRMDFNNDSKNFSEQYRKKIQNGTLHDVVDASGGGDNDAYNSVHFNHCYQRSPLGEIICNGVTKSNEENFGEEQYTGKAHNSSEQLKVLYDVRVREVHRLTELIDSMRNEHEIETKELKHQIALLLAEKERANVSQSHLQSLLVSSKQQVDDLVNKVQTLEKDNKFLESSKNEIIMEFDTAKLTIDDLQRKVMVLEKGNKNRSEAEQYELNLKFLNEKHNSELILLRKELETYTKKYEAAMKENDELKLKISKLNELNDENLAKKSEIINRLSRQIDETQKQCESLMRSTTAEENFRLQTELKMLKEEKTNLNLKLDSLEKENIRQEEELKQYESLSKISLLGVDCSESVESQCSDMNGRLGTELFRALNGQKAKREEIKNLQRQLNGKNERITQIMESERMLRKELEHYKEEIKKYLTEIESNKSVISLKENEFEKLQKVVNDLKKDLEDFNNVKIKVYNLEEERKDFIEKISALQKEKTVSNFDEELMKFQNNNLERVREEMQKHYNLEILKKNLEIEDLKREVEELKNLYVEVYNSKETLLAQIEKEKDCSSRNSAVDIEEVKRLQKELEKSRHRILGLDQTLKLQYQQEVEILNLEISQLNLQIEKMKKEKDIEVAEKDKISVENELLKSEIEHITSEKNLLFLNSEKLRKEMDELKKKIHEFKECSRDGLNELVEKHELEIKSLSSKYEITIKKLKKELDLTLEKAVKCETKSTSPMKSSWPTTRSISVQGSLTTIDKCTSPIRSAFTMESSTSPMPESKRSCRKSLSQERLTSKDVSVITDPEPVAIPKKEVIEIMEKLGAHHEEEMRTLENKYRAELAKLDRKFEIELDNAKEIIQREMQKEHQLELEEMEEKHRIELNNRIEQEKKEAVVDLITEWACEVQSLKASYAEAQAEMERMKIKYKAAKGAALQYKTYFKSKAEHMKEEWKRIEDGYEKALKELEKNVHILVDVKEDEVNAKVESITKIYEQKINKMKEKLSKCEGKLKAEKAYASRKPSESSRAQELEKLTVPDGNLCHKSSALKQKRPNDFSSRDVDIEIDEKDLKLLRRGNRAEFQDKKMSGVKLTASEKVRTSR